MKLRCSSYRPNRKTKDYQKGFGCVAISQEGSIHSPLQVSTSLESEREQLLTNYGVILFPRDLLHEDWYENFEQDRKVNPDVLRTSNGLAPKLIHFHIRYTSHLLLIAPKPNNQRTIITSQEVMQHSNEAFIQSCTDTVVTSTIDTSEIPYVIDPIHDTEATSDEFKRSAQQTWWHAKYAQETVADDLDFIDWNQNFAAIVRCSDITDECIAHAQSLLEGEEARENPLYSSSVEYPKIYRYWD